MHSSLPLWNVCKDDIGINRCRVLSVNAVTINTRNTRVTMLKRIRTKSFIPMHMMNIFNNNPFTAFVKSKTATSTVSSSSSTIDVEKQVRRNWKFFLFYFILW